MGLLPVDILHGIVDDTASGLFTLAFVTARAGIYVHTVEVDGLDTSAGIHGTFGKMLCKNGAVACFPGTSHEDKDFFLNHSASPAVSRSRDRGSFYYILQEKGDYSI
jgi:hypothetical protein